MAPTGTAQKRTEAVHFTVDTALAIVGIVLGLVAIAMAVPPMFQMLYGRPQLEFATDEVHVADGAGKVLLIAITNKKTENRFLQMIGVEREIGNVLAYFNIQDETHNFIAKDISGLLTFSSALESGFSARALPLFTVGLPIVLIHGSEAAILDARSDRSRTIGEGYYSANITIICGEQIHNITKNFKVGNAEHLTSWI